METIYYLFVCSKFTHCYWYKYQAFLLHFCFHLSMFYSLGVIVRLLCLSEWFLPWTEGCSGQAIRRHCLYCFYCLWIFRLSSVPPHLLYYCCCVNILWPWEINYFDLIWFDLKYQTRVKNTKREWKIPIASEKYQTQVKNTKR